MRKIVKRFSTYTYICNKKMVENNLTLKSDIQKI